MLNQVDVELSMGCHKQVFVFCIQTLEDQRNNICKKNFLKGPPMPKIIFIGKPYNDLTKYRQPNIDQAP